MTTTEAKEARRAELQSHWTQGVLLQEKFREGTGTGVPTEYQDLTLPWGAVYAVPTPISGPAVFELL